MKLQQIVSSTPALKNLLTIKLPVKVAYKVSKLVNKIQPELEIYEQQRNNLIKEFGEQTNVDTDTWTVKAENLSKFNEEVKKLQDIEVSVEPFPGMALEKIKIEDLGDVQVETNDLIALDWLIE